MGLLTSVLNSLLSKAIDLFANFFLFSLKNITCRYLFSQKQEKIHHIKKERYRLKATLKKLETKFDQASISESDYFRTYRNLNKEIYLIDNKIQRLQQRLEELESIKQSSRNFDNKRFYT